LRDGLPRGLPRPHTPDAPARVGLLTRTRAKAYRLRRWVQIMSAAQEPPAWPGRCATTDAVPLQKRPSAACRRP